MGRALIINETHLKRNPGLEEFLIKHSQEVITCKARVHQGIVTIENFCYEVTDPQLITFIKVKYQL